MRVTHLCEAGISSLSAVKLAACFASWTQTVWSERRTSLNRHVPLKICYLALHRGNLISFWVQSLLPISVQTPSPGNCPTARRDEGGVVYTFFVCLRPWRWEFARQTCFFHRQRVEQALCLSVCTAQQRAESSLVLTSSCIEIHRGYEIKY